LLNEPLLHSSFVYVEKYITAVGTGSPPE